MAKPSDICEWSVRRVNAHFRGEDDSHLWPVCGRFNATERAISRLRRRRRQGLELYGGLEYYLALEREICEIVNAA